MELINNNDYRFRQEGENILLAFNVVTSEMFFLRGNTKEYIISLLNGQKYNKKIDNKNIEFLKNKKIIIGR